MSFARWQSAAIASASPCAVPISQASCSRSAMSARSPSSRRTCATATRSIGRRRRVLRRQLRRHPVRGGRNSFDAVQEFGGRAVAEAARGVGAKLIHLSAIGANGTSDSTYARTKGRAEAAIHSIVPDAIIYRPSIVFGPEDSFFNKFAAMARTVARAAADRRRQDEAAAGLCQDVAEAVAKAPSTARLRRQDLRTGRP
jgi:hypothetical protein